MTAYAWKPKACVAGIEAQVAGERLEWLREHFAADVTPEMVLTDARSNNSPLHAAFEWDDSKAAERHRIWQARHLIASLTVTVEVRAKEPAKVMRAFVNVRQLGDEKRSYVPLATAMGDAEIRAQLVDRAWKDLISWREKYADLKEMAAIFAAIDREAGQRRVA